ncbi:MAG: DUF2442 domain-containing protein [Acidobacteria bacterium]|nr:DUF2442 domain-containing protein [Acidobacteriota bacterium]
MVILQTLVPPLDRFCASRSVLSRCPLSEELNGPVFTPLREVELFKRFIIAYHTLAWENGADFAPEFLREHIRVTA